MRAEGISPQERNPGAPDFGDLVPIEVLKQKLKDAPTAPATGRVLAVQAQTIRASLPAARVGDMASIERRGEPLLAEIVGFGGGEVQLLSLGDPAGIGPNDLVHASGAPLRVAVGDALLGRILDGLGRPMDDGPLPAGTRLVPVANTSVAPLKRRPIDEAMPTGIRAIDGLLSLGRGARVGLFSGPGLGKSRMLGAIARGGSADVVVVALVGERGREVREFLDEVLDEASRKNAVIVVATADAPPLERLRAVEVASAIAEHFRDEGRHVMLLVDSLTRVARAQREVGLACGEPPARRGYPPSVFALLPKLLERSGQGSTGSITAFFTVLVEGDDLDEPIADEVRGLLDGHIVLSRELASRGVFPAIDIPRSLSRLMPRLVNSEQQHAASQLRALMADYDSKRDLISLGAYSEGSDPRTDRALRAHAALTKFLCQGDDGVSWDDSLREVLALAKRYGSAEG